MEERGVYSPTTTPSHNGLHHTLAHSSTQHVQNGVADNTPHTTDYEAKIDSVSMSSAYSIEWYKLFGRHDYLKTLQSYAIKGKLRSSRFRSVCWKLYLQVLPENQAGWIERTREIREAYDSHKNQLIVNPRRSVQSKKDLTINNPLSQDNTSPWNRFFLDNELRLTIKQDVVRTFPGVEFFQTNNLQEKMIDVLFVYAKMHEKLSYRQGMHELLAPLIFVLHCDHQAFLHACEIESVGLLRADDREVIQELLNPHYIEHDAYAMFCQIMETVEPWYVSKELSPTVKHYNMHTAQPFAKLQEMHPSNVIVTKLTRIQDYLLKKYDADLQQHLEQMEITPQLYGIRWVRLLFGREFTMQDLLVLWDAIFADGVSFDLVDYVFVAMLLYLRDALLTSDYPTCLTTLMRYPPVGDINFFIQMSLYLREPNHHPRPPMYTYQKPAPLSDLSYRQNRQKWGGASSGGGGDPGVVGTNSSNSTTLADSMMSSWSSLTRRFSSHNRTRSRPTAAQSSQLRPQTLSFDQQLAKSSSEPNNLITEQSSGSHYNSTASLSKLETDDLMTRSDVFPSGTITTNGLRTCGSTASLPQLERSPTPDDRMSTKSSPGYTRTYSLSTPTRQRRTGQQTKQILPQLAQPSQTSYEVAYMLSKLNDMETMCQRCANKMDKHIDSIQKDMLHQDLDNEDDILLSLAGLKQIRDVLKGILKPSSLFEGGREEDGASPMMISSSTPVSNPTCTPNLTTTTTNHSTSYNYHPPSFTEPTPNSQTSYEPPQEHPLKHYNHKQGVTGAGALHASEGSTASGTGGSGGGRSGKLAHNEFYMGSSVDTDQCSTDSSSPEYSENIPRHLKQAAVSSRSTNCKEIELKDLKKNSNQSQNMTYPQQPSTVTSGLPISDETLNRYRQSYTNYPALFPTTTPTSAAAAGSIMSTHHPYSQGSGGAAAAAAAAASASSSSCNTYSPQHHPYPHHQHQRSLSMGNGNLDGLDNNLNHRHHPTAARRRLSQDHHDNR